MTPPNPPRSPSAILSHPAVLIVEDEPRLRELLLDMVPQMGYPASAVPTAEDALAALQSRPREILLLDLKLPGTLQGMDLFRIVRDRYPTTQVIVMTAHAELHNARQALWLQAADFLPKPCRLAELESALERARQRLPSALANLPTPTTAPPPPPSPSLTPPSTLADTERLAIESALAHHNGNRSAAARALGISRRTLLYRLAQYRSLPPLPPTPPT